MEEKPVCRVKDGYVRQSMLLIGMSEGKSRFVISDNASDRGHDPATVVIPLYDAKEYIRKRIPEYGREVYEE
jgi:hypothetical protein